MTIIEAMDQAVIAPRRWCILRMSPSRTLLLATSLADAGFQVWTPSEKVSRRKSRSREMVEFDVPMLPSWVFADAARLSELLSLPAGRHPAFSIFRYYDRIPVIGEGELSRLRILEEQAADRARRKAAKGKRHAFEAGARVSVVEREGAWRGLSGVVESGDGRDAMVSFGGALSVKIATWLLVSTDVAGRHTVASVG